MLKRTAPRRFTRAVIGDEVADHTIRKRQQVKRTNQSLGDIFPGVNGMGEATMRAAVTFFGGWIAVTVICTLIGYGAQLQCGREGICGIYTLFGVVFGFFLGLVGSVIDLVIRRYRRR